MKQSKIRKNKFVKRYTCNQDGFTLIEMLLSFLIFSFLIIFLLHSIPLLKYHAYSTETLDQLHWDIFLNQIKREIRTVETIYLSNHQLDLIKNGCLITYDQYGEKIRRRVDGGGYEITMFNIKELTFKELKKGVKVIVLHKNGKTYEGDIYLPNGIPITNKG